ncbi:MAG: redox-regulated ATPase YchF [Syntrophomonadaceae bacterium]|nr:redox-regulated ATPase YchF [Syntrophomonadaceae bacterium]
MQLGIIGMPMVGKSSIFELLTENTGRSHGGNKANVAMARIPDTRIDYLSGVFKPKKTTYAQMEVVDIPGLVPGADRAAAVFLDSVRKADALLMVVRLFNDDTIPIYGDNIDPVSDIETINYELLLADLDLIEKRIERINANKKKALMADELSLLERLQSALEDEQPLSSLDLSDKDQEFLTAYQFLTLKPLLVCLNLSDDQLASHDFGGRDEVYTYCTEHNLPVVEVSASIERDIMELNEEEKDIFMEELGIDEAGIVKISRTMYDHLGLMSFFTVGEDEVKAWTIEKGTAARKAAGKIHSDIERGFIRAEVVNYDEFKELGSMTAIKEKGLFRLEGKEYIVKDGEIVHFRFNV